MKMNKISKLIVAGLFVASFAGAEVINWQPYYYLYDSAGALSADGIAQLYVDVGGDNAGTWYDDMQVDKTGALVGTGLGAQGTANDVMLGVVGNNSQVLAGFVGGGAVGSLADPLTGGSSIYMVVFNAPTIAAASQSFVYEVAPYVVPAGSGVGSTPPADYFVAKVDGEFNPINAAGQWNEVVPEPATIGLMGVAGLGLLLARRKGRR